VARATPATRRRGGETRMTADVWEACDDPRKLLEWARRIGTDRQFRLFACAFWRWAEAKGGELPPPVTEALEFAESWAETGVRLARATGTDGARCGELVGPWVAGVRPGLDRPGRACPAARPGPGGVRQPIPPGPGCGGVAVEIGGRAGPVGGRRAGLRPAPDPGRCAGGRGVRRGRAADALPQLWASRSGVLGPGPCTREGVGSPNKRPQQTAAAYRLLVFEGSLAAAAAEPVRSARVAASGPVPSAALN
jgi:hypothetical protein